VIGFFLNPAGRPAATGRQGERNARTTANPRYNTQRGFSCQAQWRPRTQPDRHRQGMIVRTEPDEPEKNPFLTAHEPRQRNSELRPVRRHMPLTMRPVPEGHEHAEKTNSPEAGSRAAGVTMIATKRPWRRPLGSPRVESISESRTPGVSTAWSARRKHREHEEHHVSPPAAGRRSRWLQRTDAAEHEQRG